MAGETVFTQVRSLNDPYPDVRALIHEFGQYLPSDALNGENWTLTDAASARRLRTMEAAGIPLDEYVHGQIYYGIKTGFNTAFVIDSATRDALIHQDARSAELIKPLAVGDDIRKWRIEQRDRWLIFTRRGVLIDSYPAIKAHLQQWRSNLEPKPRNWPTNAVWSGRKPGSYKWYEIQDDIAYYAAFDLPKIVYPEIAMKPRFAFDATGALTNNKAFLIAKDDFYLLGVLNSAPAWEHTKSLCAVLGDENKSLSGK